MQVLRQSTGEMLKFDSGSGEVCPPNFRVHEIAASQCGQTEVRIRKIGLIEVGVCQFCPAEASRPEILPAKVAAGVVRLPRVPFWNVIRAEIDAAQVMGLVTSRRIELRKRNSAARGRGE